MALNPRQKYQVVKDGKVFNVTRELYPNIEITFFDKVKKIIEATYFESALFDGRIKKLTAKPKPKAIIEFDIGLDYRIKREQIFLNEGKPNMYHELLNQIK